MLLAIIKIKLFFGMKTLYVAKSLCRQFARFWRILNPRLAVNCQVKPLLSVFVCRFGFNKWRDPMRPTQILAKLCKDEGLDGPHYSTGRVRIDNKVFGATSQVLEESGMLNNSNLSLRLPRRQRCGAKSLGRGPS